MSNYKISDEIMDKYEQLSEIVEHIRDLNSQKTELQDAIIESTGFDETPITGTTTFESEDGRELKLAVTETLLLDFSKDLVEVSFNYLDDKGNTKTFSMLPNELVSIAGAGFTLKKRAYGKLDDQTKQEFNKVFDQIPKQSRPSIK